MGFSNHLVAEFNNLAVDSNNDQLVVSSKGAAVNFEAHPEEAKDKEAKDKEAKDKEAGAGRDQQALKDSAISQARADKSMEELASNSHNDSYKQHSKTLG